MAGGGQKIGLRRNAQLRDQPRLTIYDQLNAKSAALAVRVALEMPVNVNVSPNVSVMVAELFPPTAPCPSNAAKSCACDIPEFR
jgi:hypothetical protein